MNKKNITYILIGILLVTLQFTVKIGPSTVDIFSDIIGYALILIGLREMVPRNVMFKKSRNKAIIGLIVACLGQALMLMDWGVDFSTMKTLIAAFTTIFAIYFTYYFTEAIILESKFQDKSASTRSLRITWAIYGLLFFIEYIAFMSNISMAAILTQAVVVICALYYCSSVLTATRQLYMEGLPTARMETKNNK
jgi:hypothetical protein